VLSILQYEYSGLAGGQPSGDTFASLGIPFRFFGAPVEEAAGFELRGHCSICLLIPTPTVKLGPGSDIVVRCRRCGTTNALDVGLQQRTPCRQCGRRIAFPRLDYVWDIIGEKKKQTVEVCSECLRTGRAAITKRTEHGIVTWESAQQGVIDQGVHVPAETLIELVRTPAYRSWAGPVWLFCCDEPMTYVGAWSREQFDEAAADGDGQSLLAHILGDGADADIDAMWDGDFGYSPRVYVFRCLTCGSLRANSDTMPPGYSVHPLRRRTTPRRGRP